MFSNAWEIALKRDFTSLSSIDYWSVVNTIYQWLIIFNWNRIFNYTVFSSSSSVSSVDSAYTVCCPISAMVVKIFTQWLFCILIISISLLAIHLWVRKIVNQNLCDRYTIQKKWAYVNGYPFHNFANHIVWLGYFKSRFVWIKI